MITTERISLPVGLSWHGEALCRNEEHDPDDWFPERGDEEMKAAQDRAVRICMRCPVQRPCLIDALKTQEPFGIRGGWTHIQRARFLRLRLSRRRRGD